MIRIEDNFTNSSNDKWENEDEWELQEDEWGLEDGVT